MGRGALLSLPRGGRRHVVIQTKLFEEYAEENVAGWFHWSKVKRLPIERMEDLVLIYGCTLVTSWAAVVFDDAMEARVSLASRPLNNGGASIVWSNVNGTLEHHDSQLDTVCSLPCYVLLGALCTDQFFFPREFHTHPIINACSSSTYKQSQTSSGQRSSGRQRPPLVIPEQRSVLLPE